jgi:hypothetical protein
MSDQFSDPGTSTGINLNDLEGSLLLVKPVRVEHGIKTSLGDRDATVAHVHVVDGDQAGTVYPEVFIWPRVLQGQLRANLGTDRFTIGRLGKGTAKPGQNAPWKLEAATDADKKAATTYLAKPAPAAPVVDDAPPF